MPGPLVLLVRYGADCHCRRRGGWPPEASRRLERLGYLALPGRPRIPLANSQATAGSLAAPLVVRAEPDRMIPC
jgi:hypothetical protein